VTNSVSQNKEFYKTIKSGHANFHLADFHVHSPASYDVRNTPHFEKLPEYVSEKLKEISTNITKNLVEYENQVLNAYPPSSYYDELVTHRNSAFPDDMGLGGWAIAAITDHNVCKYACEVANYAWAKIKENRLVVLPGIELSVSYPIFSEGNKATAHVLCIFRPNVSDSDIRMAISNAANDNWCFGDDIELKSLTAFVNSIRNHTDYPAICIAAHVGSSHGVQSETKKTMLSWKEATISRITSGFLLNEGSNEEDLKFHLEFFKSQRNQTEQIDLQTLEIIGGCGFDALQVSKIEDEKHYRLLHRFKEEMGRSIPIICSDAHRVKDVFTASNGTPHIKLPEISGELLPQQVFDFIKQSLRYGETRFSVVVPGRPKYWISGIEITPDASGASHFWPFENKVNNSESFVLSFSRNLNCFIGGRGSGKSAGLESLAFILKSSDFDGIAKTKEDDIQDFYKRARATISGCNIKLCIQFIEHEMTKEFPKKAVFANRYFDPNGRHSKVSYFKIDDTELLSDQLPMLNVQYYRLGEIEAQTEPEKLRILFDQICGIQIEEHEHDIRKLINKLKEQRKNMVEVSQKISKLTSNDSPLLNYVHRKILFNEVNIPEIKDAYEEIDKVEAAETRANLANEEWKEIMQELDLDGFIKKITVYFDKLYHDSMKDNANPKRYMQKIAQISAITVNIGDDEEAYLERIIKAIRLLQKEVDGVGDAIKSALDEIVSISKDLRNNLQERGLPTGSKDREAKKIAFDEAEKALITYRDLIREWDSMNEERKTMVIELQSICAEKSELRKKTAQEINLKLEKALDPLVLVVEADAQVQSDKNTFINWMYENFSAQTFKYKEARIKALISEGLTTTRLRSILLNEEIYDDSVLCVKRKNAEAGAIDKNVARDIRERCTGRYRLDSDKHIKDTEMNLWDNLPKEIKDGLITFSGNGYDDDKLKINDVLQLDEIIFDDVPVIRLNDRPKDEKSKPRPIADLSPGQRCSAILPIILLTGSSPLLLDQPEDNLDNRLIRQVIVNILSNIKLDRQVILATHNPNIPVLGDVEKAIVLQGIGEKECELRVAGNLDSSSVVHHLTEVMEGGREAFQYRQAIYQTHWAGYISAISSNS